jgi:hypothetical protein
MWVSKIDVEEDVDRRSDHFATFFLVEVLPPRQSFCPETKRKLRTAPEAAEIEFIGGVGDLECGSVNELLRALTRSFLSAPRATIRSAPFGDGRCSACF